MIEFKFHSGLHTLKSTQMLNTDLKGAWAFLLSPNNLNLITPKDMNIHITSDFVSEMYSGQLITYDITILKALKFKWVTEITHIIDERLFVDEQRFGPYRFWHHTHIVERVAEQVLMTDIVSYKVSWGFWDRILNFFFVEKKLEAIFKYRASILDEIFNQNK